MPQLINGVQLLFFTGSISHLKLIKSGINSKLLCPNFGEAYIPNPIE